MREGNELSIRNDWDFKKQGIQKYSHAPESDHEVSQINPRLSTMTELMFLSKVSVENT